MKYVYVTIRNILLFYFIASLFQTALRVENNTFSDYLLPAIIFGVVLSALPVILSFLKIKENAAALMLAGVVLIFAYYFIGYYVFDLFTISGGSIQLGLEALTIDIEDQTMGLILISVFSSILSVILEVLNSKKK